MLFNTYLTQNVMQPAENIKLSFTHFNWTVFLSELHFANARELLLFYVLHKYIYVHKNNSKDISL